jgi:hypothetical protein
MKINVLCIGDVVGRPGRRILAEKLVHIVKENDIDCVIVNAENVAGGSGITPQIYNKLLKYGVNLITLGDHAYRKRDIIPTLENADNIVRPANLSEFAAGKTTALYQTGKGTIVGVVALIGRTFMQPAENPFNVIDRILPKFSRSADIIFVDMHAEASSEKVAMGYNLDGRVACCFGTHTHVATADEKIMPKGTAYITDIGMTGPHDSVLGRKADSVLKFFKTQLPVPFEVASGHPQLNGIIVTVDSNSKKADSIKRFQLDVDFQDTQTYDSDDGRPEAPSGF